MGVIISGDELTWRGKPMPYLKRAITEGEDGVILVTLTFPDQVDGDEIILVAMPDDLLSAYNDHFAANFVKAGVRPSQSHAICATLGAASTALNGLVPPIRRNSLSTDA